MDFNLAVKKILRRAGLEVKLYNFLNAEGPLLKKIIADHKIQTVIDVGANEGQYAEDILNNGFKGQIFSFEPIQKPFAVLKKKAVKSLHWSALNLAVGARDEDMTINVSENVVSSSIYEVASASVSVEPSSQIVRKEKIKVTSIDNFLASKTVSKEILLKLDVQGFELEALKGSVKSLEYIKFVQVELSFVPLYEDAPLFIEIASFLQNSGFEVFTFLPGFRDKKTGRLLQADGVFIKKINH